MSEFKLLPCPFCGGDANAKPHSQHMPGCFFLEDAENRVKLSNLDASHTSIVLEAWNRRAPQAEPMAQEAKSIGCAVNNYSSRMCERGTKGCVVNHATPHQPVSVEVSDERILSLAQSLSYTDRHDAIKFARAILALAGGATKGVSE